MRSISVLLVDENLTFLRVATRLLEAYEDVSVVGTACEGEDVLEQVKNVHPDVVLIDISILNPSGLDIIPHLRVVSPRVGVIALASLSTDGYRQAAMEAGADDFIPKAAIGADLLPAIRRVAEASRLRENIVGAVET